MRPERNIFIIITTTRTGLLIEWKLKWNWYIRTILYTFFFTWLHDKSATEIIKKYIKSRKIYKVSHYTYTSTIHKFNFLLLKLFLNNVLVIVQFNTILWKVNSWALQFLVTTTWSYYRIIWLIFNHVNIHCIGNSISKQIRRLRCSLSQKLCQKSTTEFCFLSWRSWIIIVHVICTEKLYWRKSTIKWLIFEEMAIAVTHPEETSASYRYLNVFTAWNFLSMLDLDDT